MCSSGRALRTAALVLAAAALGVSGCGDDDGAGSGSSGAQRVRVALDFTPNAVHAPIFTAARTGLDLRSGVRLEIQRPGSRPDSVKAITSGAADIGVLDIQDLAIARSKGADIVAVAALVQRPLGALVTRADIRRPRDLEGETVGVSGLPSDPPFLKAIVEDDGGDASTIRQVTIGFNAVSALLGKRVAAVPVFWTVEGLVLKQKGRRFNEFRIDDYGAPRFPEVVLVTTTATLRDHRDRVRRTLAAIADGAEKVRTDAAPAIAEIARESGDADLALVRAQFAALGPIVDPRLTLRRPVIEAWARFAARVGLLETAPDVGSAFAFGLTP